MENFKKIILAMNEMGMVQSKCPECGNILKSNHEEKCDRCKARFDNDDADVRFVDVRWN